MAPVSPYRSLLPVENVPDGEYKTIAASTAATGLGTNGGALGDVLYGLLILPATTSPGAVSITDGAGSAITIHPGGATSVVDLKPYRVELMGIISTSGAWKVTTGANVSVIAVGKFT